MVRMQRQAWALAILVAVLARANNVRADGGPVAWIFPNESQPNSYSPARIWAPRLARIHDYFHGPKLDVYPPDRHPEIPPDYKILRFPCSAADPAATLIERPAPPATSKFRY